VVEPGGQLHLIVAPASPIKHVVIIVKENHGYDNYFGAFAGGNGASMARSPNPPPKDPNHRHAAWLTRVNFGLPSLNARTKVADGMADCFDFSQPPLPPPT
jgi:phosphoesterase family protein